MGLSLGKILGSLSPAFGMATGKGLFGHLPLNAMGQSGLGGIMGMLMSHGSQGGDAPTSPAQPAPAMPGSGVPGLPDYAGGINGAFSANAALGAQHPSAMGNIGSALHANASPDPGVSLGQAPQMHNSGILQSVLADQGGGMGGGGGWHDILMRLGIMR